MSNWLLYGIGFLAQLLFSGRLIVQWVVSEKNKRIMTPSLFWKMSLAASLLLFIYGYLRKDFAIMLGQVLTYFIYIRNLQLQGEWQKILKGMRVGIFVLPLVLILYILINGSYSFESLFSKEFIAPWLIGLGIASQLLFTFRFVYQWIYSERKRTSDLPLGFWVLSLLGATLILIYAFFRLDPVLIIAHGAGLVIYSRNILIWSKQDETT